MCLSCGIRCTWEKLLSFPGTISCTSIIQYLLYRNLLALYPQLAFTIVGLLYPVLGSTGLFSCQPFITSKQLLMLMPPVSPLPSSPPTFTLYTLALEAQPKCNPVAVPPQCVHVHQCLHNDLHFGTCHTWTVNQSICCTLLTPFASLNSG